MYCFNDYTDLNVNSSVAVAQLSWVLASLLFLAIVFQIFIAHFLIRQHPERVWAEMLAGKNV